MAAKRFYAEGAGTTKAALFEMLKEAVSLANEIHEPSDLGPADTIGRSILFKAKDITDADAQTYVNDIEILRDEYIDCGEEDWVDARDEMELKLVDVLNSRWAGKRGA